MPKNSELRVAAAYIRVSSDRQTELSPDSQISVIQKYAKDNGYILPKENIFRDDGISGSRADKRPEFIRLIAMSKEKPAPFDAILLWKFSRFARNQEESIYYKAQLRKKGIDVISVSEPIDDGAFGKLIERIIEWEDEYYLIRLSGEVKRSMTEKVERGQPVSIPPFGYDIENKEFVINKEKAPLVQKIYADYINGKSAQRLAREFNALGIKTNRGNMWENRTIDYILQNPVYIGKIRWNTKHRTRRNYQDDGIIIRDGHHEPIISVEDFEKVQEIIAEHKRNHPPYYRHAERGSKSDYMLHGLLKCGNCGASLTRSNVGVQCIKYAHGKGCDVSHYINMKALEKLVLSAVEVAFATGSFNLELSEAPKEEIEIDVAVLIDREKRKLSRLYDAFEDGIYTKEEFSERRELVRSQIEKLEGYKPKPSDIAEKRRQLVETKKSVIPLLKSKTTSEGEKNAILRSFISKIVFDRPSGTVDLFFYA